jgi:endo-1,4-beta-xylanase
MMLFSSLLFAASAVTALPPLSWGEKFHGESSKLETRQSGRGLGQGSDRDGYGFHSGYFYSFWTQGGGTVTYNNLLNGTYKSSWQNIQNWVGGKGWNPGGPKVVVYNGTWSGRNVNSYLALYGWTRNPLIECKSTHGNKEEWRTNVPSLQTT